MFNSIRWKLFTIYLVLSIIALLVTGMMSSWLLEKFYLETIKMQLAEQSQIMVYLIEQVSGNGTGAQEVVNGIGDNFSRRVTIIDAQGKVLGDSLFDPLQLDNQALYPEIASARKTGTGSVVRKNPALAQKMVYFARAFKLDGETAFVRLAIPLDIVNRPLYAIRRSLFGIFLLVCLVVLAFSWRIGYTMTKPIPEILRTARRIAAGDAVEPLKSTSADEIGILARTINRVAITIKDKVDALTTEANKLEAILDNMDSGVLVLDRMGFVQRMNPAAERMAGVSANKAKGLHHLAVWRNQELSGKLEQVYTSRLVVSFELRQGFASKQVFQANIAPVAGTDEVISGVVIVLHDITEVKRIAEMRTEFAANVSHELRTPLAAIKGFAETLKDGLVADPQTALRFAGIIDREAERLTDLIEGLLELTTLESGKMLLEKQSVSLPTLVEGVIDAIKQRVEAKNLQVSIQIPVDLQVQADGLLLHQILINLLDNAVKYNIDGGSIVVTAEQVADDVRIAVRDTGIGIPLADLERIFERFYRVDKARTRKLGGAGLGLSIVKHAVEAHGGRLGVDSSLGQGTEFFFTLPACVSSWEVS